MSFRGCVLCDTSLHDGSKTSVVKDKQLASYAVASRKRGDGKVAIFRRSTFLEAHEKCRKHYVTQSSIDAFIKRAKKDAAKPKLRSSGVPNFVFKTHCFLCAEQTPPNYAEQQRKSRPNKRDPVHLVTKIDVKDKVLRLLENRSDELAHCIRQRLLAVNDLVAADGQYHLSCFNRLYHPPTKSETKGGPTDPVDVAMEPIHTFLENSDEECQFSMEELIGKIECDPKPYPKTVRARLLAKYGDDVFVSVNAPFVVCFKNTGYKIITESWYQQKSSDEREERLGIVRTAAAIIVEDIRGQIYDNSQFEAEVQRLSQIGPTAKLWLQYLEILTLMMRFIQSERMGNWDLHLETINNIIPYFHASGHYLYAKCAHLYFQDMADLENRMPSEEFASFTAQGGFTIRRAEKLWSGTWSDMSIEQCLMRQMKTDGGLTRHRGVSDAISSRWTLGIAAQQEVCEAFESFCGSTFATSEQHVDSRDSRIKRDNEHMKIMLEWLRHHPPFSDTPDLMSISNGMVGNENINCHLSREVGITGMKAMVGSDFGTIKFKRADRVLPLASVNSALIIGNQPVPINPTTLFQRITIAKQSDADLEEYLFYELCPYPLALFDGCGMRKGTKSTSYKAFQTMPDTHTLPGNTVYVIDGGSLLHRVVWTSGHSFAQICSRYIEYVRSKYKSTAVVAFDGYNEKHQSTKYMERVRRSTKKHSVEIIFNDTMVPTVSQENFLANSKNKSRLISSLITKFKEANIATKQAVEDADTLIVTTAISLASHYGSVAVVGEDVDLLVIMIGMSTSSNVYFMKPKKRKAPSSLFHPPTTIDKHLAEHILFLHAVSGCVSKSAVYKQGKLKCLKVLTKNPDLKFHLTRFREPNADEEALFEAGEKFLVALYGGDHHDTTLHKLRYKQYLTSAYKITSNLASIPPTAAAARQHFLRGFYQIQLWLGNDQLDAKQWGWKSSRNGLIPVKTLLPPAPDEVLRKVACHCKKNCMGNCGCRRAGLFCTNICAECKGKCANTDSVDFEELDDEDTVFCQTAPVQPVQYSSSTVTTEGYEEPQSGPSNILAQSQPGPSHAGLPKKRRKLKTDDPEPKVMKK